MNNEEVKTIDLFEVAKYVWKSKIIVILCTIIFAGLGFYLSRSEAPLYMTSVWVRLPQYVDTQTVNTAVQVANGNIMRDMYIQKGMDPDNPSVDVTASVLNKSSVIRLAFQGNNPEEIKSFADSFQTVYVNEVNKFVNEAVLGDLENLKLQGNGTVLVNPSLSMAKAEVIKDGAVPTADINAGSKLTKIVKFTLLGLFIGVGIGVLRYGYAMVKKEE